MQSSKLTLNLCPFWFSTVFHSITKLNFTSNLGVKSYQSRVKRARTSFLKKFWRKGKQKGRALDAWTNSHLVLKKRALHGHSAPRDRLNSFFGPPWAFKDKKCLDWYQFRNVLNFKESRRKMQNLVKGCIWYCDKTEVKKTKHF